MVLDESTNETWLFVESVLQVTIRIVIFFKNYFLGFLPQFSYIENFVFPPPKLAKVVEIALEKQTKLKYFLNFWLKHDKKIPKNEHCSH